MWTKIPHSIKITYYYFLECFGDNGKPLGGNLRDNQFKASSEMNKYDQIFQISKQKLCVISILIEWEKLDVSLDNFKKIY